MSSSVNMDWIWEGLHSLEEFFRSLPPSSSPSTSLPLRPTQLNDYVYELCKPQERPSVEVVFFHGLQLNGSKEAYVTKWLSRDEQAIELWPCWIAERFPDARILLISYDGFARKTDDQGRTDMYITSENLVQSLTEESAQVGRDGCPVILVGHCLGGLVIKELLLRANSILSLDDLDNPDEYTECLLESVKEVFYYATPHHGSRFADIKTDFSKGLLAERLTTLNKEAARCNDDFRKLRRRFKWKAYGIAESCPLTLGQFELQLLVEEASARSDVDGLLTVDAHHFDVCRPKSKTDSSFSQLINVIDRVLKQDARGHEMSFSSKVVGLDDQVEIVTQALKKARRLGIVGTGGMGKSTLAKAVYNSISGDFEYTCFLSDVKNSIRRTDTTEVLRQKISESLYYKGRRKTVDWSRLKGRRILFVLDDVDHRSQVYATLDGFSNESCVLVTSRDGRLVRSMDFKVHDAKLLGFEASNQLFCLHAFKGADAPQAYKEHVDRLSSKCGGLPLALEVTGKYLATQNVGGTVFVDTFNKLSQAKALDGSKDDDLWAVFQLIYDRLAEDEQQMFLDIATCFQREELELVKRAWRACSWAEHSADAGWQNLLDKGLVTLAPFGETDQPGAWVRGMWTEYRYIQMHEVLRDLGRRIASPSRKIDKVSTRICYDGLDRIPTWPFNQGKSNFEVRILKIVITGEGRDPRPTIHIETLSGLEKLEILWLGGVRVCGPWNLFPINLEFLKLGDCYWGDEGKFERPCKRVRMEGSSSHREAFSEKLWEHPTLRHFEIEYFKDLEPLLDTLGLDARESLQALESLMFQGTSQAARIEHVDDTFEQLRHITIGEYRIIISRCSGLEAPTKHLTVAVMSHFPKSLGQLSALEHLEISACEDLIALPNTLGRLSGLRHLVISKCPDLRGFPDKLWEFQALEQLEISYCGIVHLDSINPITCQFYPFLPIGFPDIRPGCPLKGLAITEGRLHVLRDFVISNCPHLVGLPNIQLPALEHLEISYCDKLKVFPCTLGRVSRLQNFVISNCPSLERLQISYCDKLEGLPDSLGPLPHLRDLVISNCSQLCRLPSGLGELPALERLQISYCDKLEGLPDSLGPLPRLRNLVISNCSQLCRLPDSLGELPALEGLEISYCYRLQVLPNRLRERLGETSCNFCGIGPPHWENDCHFIEVRAQLKEQNLTVANLSRNRPHANLTDELEDPPEDSDDDSPEVEDSADGSSD